MKNNNIILVHCSTHNSCTVQSRSKSYIFSFSFSFFEKSINRISNIDIPTDEQHPSHNGSVHYERALHCVECIFSIGINVTLSCKLGRFTNNGGCITNDRRSCQLTIIIMSFAEFWQFSNDNVGDQNMYVISVFLALVSSAARYLFYFRLIFLHRSYVRQQCVFLFRRASVVPTNTSVNNTIQAFGSFRSG